jgi:hypothetical protein
MLSKYNKLITILQKKYSVVGIINLSETDTLVTKLGEFANKEFDVDERLLVIADKSLPTTYEGEPPDILPDFQMYVRDANIAHPFILVLTDIDNLAEHLLQLQQTRYRQETMPIPSINV